MGGLEFMRILALLPWRDDDTRAARPAAKRLAAWALLAAGGAAGGVLAQGSVPCTAIDNDAERLACYDRALRPDGAPRPAAAPAPSESAPPTLGTSDRRSERRIRESTATTAPAAPAASAAPAAPAAPAARSIAASGDEIIPIVVVNVRALPGRETTFTDGEGTRWVQTDSQRIVNLPDAPFDAELKRGAMGSYFLVPKDQGRAVRVRQAR